MHRYPLRTLYLGIDPGNQNCVHYPVIRIQPRSSKDPEMCQAFADLPFYTHLIFTSKQTVIGFFQQKFDRKLLDQKILIVIGSGTAKELEKQGFHATYCPKEQTQEGVIALLNSISVDQNAYFFYPRSSLARPLLAEFLQKWRVRLLDFYCTQYQQLDPVPDLKLFDRIIFTSPSTVQGFLKIFGKLPDDKELVAIGPITAEELRKYGSIDSITHLQH